MKSELQAVIQQTIDAFQVGNFDLARAILNKSLQGDLSNTETIFDLGISYAEANKFEEALIILYCLRLYKSSDVSISYNIGVIHSLEGKYKLSLEAYDLVLKLQPDYVEALINKGAIHNEMRDYVLALEILDYAIKINKNYYEAYLNKGNTLHELKRYDDAIENYDKALSLKFDYYDIWVNKGASLKELKRYEEAITHFDMALSLRPRDLEALINRGSTLSELKRYDEAIAHCDEVLSLKPDYAQAWSNKGVILKELRRYNEAIAHYDKALSLKPDYAEGWSNKGVALHELKRCDEAITYFDKALSLNPDYHEAWSNKGVTLCGLKRYEEAVTYFDKALSLNPDYHVAWSNKGMTLHELRRYDEAIAHYDKALSLNPDYHEALANKGVTLHELKRYKDAITYYEKALILKPDIDWAYGYLLHTKMKIGSWSGLRESFENIVKKVLTKEKVATPFLLLSINDDAFLQKKAAQIFAEDKYPAHPSLGYIPKSAKKERIRIAYFSPDFRNHPVSFLTAELFEIHNRHSFEVFAFSLQKAPIVDEMNLRLRSRFDKFLDVENMSDKEIAQLAREYEVDIAIDLAGLTQYSRTGVFSYRAAPIQINWLGYPGTIGADYIDYIVADRTIIPESHHEFYVEKVVCLPDTYIVDDSKRVASSRVFTRKECGLPQNAFVFCCFNNDYKFNSQVLDRWSRILLRVKNSVLWISENNEYFKSSIIGEFERRGLDRNRLIFAKRVELMADHLARYSLADLFLDTHPYNAHTTALDSLKSGVPILTLIGQSFAGRVSASLLNAIGLPELITSTQEEYEALAIELALNPKKLAAIKLKLANNRLTAPLFDTPLFTKNLEVAFIKMYERYEADLQPDHITIA